MKSPLAERVQAVKRLKTRTFFESVSIVLKKASFFKCLDIFRRIPPNRHFLTARLRPQASFRKIALLAGYATARRL